MSDIFHTVVYADPIRCSVTTPLGDTINHDASLQEQISQFHLFTKGNNIDITRHLLGNPKDIICSLYKCGYDCAEQGCHINDLFGIADKTFCRYTSFQHPNSTPLLS